MELRLTYVFTTFIGKSRRGTAAGSTFPHSPMPDQSFIPPQTTALATI